MRQRESRGKANGGLVPAVRGKSAGVCQPRHDCAAGRTLGKLRRQARVPDPGSGGLSISLPCSRTIGAEMRARWIC